MTKRRLAWIFYSLLAGVIISGIYLNFLLTKQTYKTSWLQKGRSLFEWEFFEPISEFSKRQQERKTAEIRFKIETEKRNKKRKCYDSFLKTFHDKNGFVGSSVNGGLGNQMFSYASVYGIAVRLNKTVLVENKNMLHKFFTLNAISVGKCVLRSAAMKLERKHSCFDERLFKLEKGRNYYVGPFLQSWKYFHSAAERVRGQFVFKTEITAKARIIFDEFVTKIKKDTSEERTTYVGIHVRRGDILARSKFIKYGYLAAPKTYIEKAMLYFTRNYSKVAFLIGSDNLTWAKENIKHPNVFYLDGNSPEVDMSVLIKCNHTIMTVGSFGWWIGFLTRGITLYYKYPAKKNSPLSRQFSKDYSDYYYPGWIGMQ